MQWVSAWKCEWKKSLAAIVWYSNGHHKYKSYMWRMTWRAVAPDSSAKEKLKIQSTQRINL